MVDLEGEKTEERVFTLFRTLAWLEVDSFSLWHFSPLLHFLLPLPTIAASSWNIK